MKSVFLEFINNLMTYNGFRKTLFYEEQFIWFMKSGRDVTRRSQRRRRVTQRRTFPRIRAKNF